LGGKKESRSVGIKLGKRNPPSLHLLLLPQKKPKNSNGALERRKQIQAKLVSHTAYHTLLIRELLQIFQNIDKDLFSLGYCDIPITHNVSKEKKRKFCVKNCSASPCSPPRQEAAAKAQDALVGCSSSSF
jgi:hypothetical protein